MRKTLCLVSAALALPICSSAVTFNIVGSTLKGVNGQPMPEGGLLILAASTLDSTFTPASTTDFFPSDDDIIIQKWAIEGNSGAVDHSIPNATPSGDWNQGDPLMLYWFPTLTVGATEPGQTTPYGTYRTDSSALGDAWVTPSSSFNFPVSLFFETTDQEPTSPFTGLPTNFTPVPEPASAAGVFASLCLAGGVIMRLRHRRASADA
jgi:hypothetical protein